MSQNSVYTDNSEVSEDEVHSTNGCIGSCSICHRSDIKVISSRGKLFAHGPRGRRCRGSHSTPYDVRTSQRTANTSISSSLSSNSSSSQTYVKTAYYASSSYSTQAFSPVSKADHVRDESGRFQNESHLQRNNHNDSVSTHHSNINPGAAVDTTSNLLLNANPSVTTPYNRLCHPVTSSHALKHIPRAARIQCAALLNRVLEDIVKDPSDLSHWRRLLDFGSLLSKPKRGGAESNITNVIIKRIRAFDLIDRSPRQSSKRENSSKHSKFKSDDSKLASLVTAKLEDGNFRCAVRIITSSDSPALNSQETFEVLQEKHPKAASDRSVPVYPFDNDAFKSRVVNTGDIMKAISSFPSGSAGGPDGLLPQHLKDLTGKQTADTRLLSSLTAFVNLLLSTKVAPEVNRIIFGGKLIGIQKKDGGIRPITIGYTLRRITGKAANKHAMERASSILSPLQVGVGSPLGAEATAHATRL